MIIDDNYTDRYVGEIRLKKHPFAKEVILKDSGRSALEFLKLFCQLTCDNNPALRRDLSQHGKGIEEAVGAFKKDTGAVAFDGTGEFGLPSPFFVR